MLGPYISITRRALNEPPSLTSLSRLLPFVTPWQLAAPVSYTSPVPLSNNAVSRRGQSLDCELCALKETRIIVGPWLGRGICVTSDECAISSVAQ